jgi:asparagine synthase (glutamine-hydrolysing)
MNAGLYTKRVNWDFVSSCLAYPQQRTGRTGLADVHELLPGYCLNVSGAHTEANQEWSPWSHVEPGARYADPAEARADIRRSVSIAVKALAEADRSILLQLSGGLDSSIVGACLQDAEASVTCGTMLTEVPGADERQYARLVADELGASLRTVKLRFEDARFNFTPPGYLTSPSIMALHYAVNLALDTLGEQLDVTSYFSGAGGDAVFCYLKTAAPAADAIRQRGLVLGRRSILDLANLHQCTLWKAGRLTVKKLLRAPAPPRKADLSFVAPSEIASDLENHPWFDAPPDALPGDRERIFDLAFSHSYRDSSARGAKRRMRMPLLSQPVMEACLKAPSWMWFEGGKNRALARSAFADILPREVAERSSKGSFMNYTAAIYRRNVAPLKDFLLTGHLQSRGLLDCDALRRFFQTELRPRDQSFMRILDLAMIENWVRHQS